MNDMTDLSFTQTSRAMSSKPLARVNNEYKPWWKIVAENNKKPYVLREHKCKDSTFFMGC